VAATYSAPSDSTVAANGIILYVDGAAVSSTKINNSNYAAMQNGAEEVRIGAQRNSADDGNEKFFGDKIDEVAIFSDVLTPTEISSLIVESPLEITTPYLTEDLFELDIKQSADVMFITHDDYEPRRLSRLSDTNWTLAVEGIEDGPFLDENTTVSQTITSSATAVGATTTLTATGCTPFVSGTTAGHSPSGALATSKSQTGALFKLVHGLAVSAISDSLAANTLNDVTTTLEVAQGITWDFTTNGTWGGTDGATVVLERSYDSGTTYETVATITSANNDNIVTQGTEEVADALYRARVSEAGADGTVGTCQIQFSVRDSSHIGIVKITSVTSPTIATGIIIKVIGNTTATHRWSEGAWSNYRGWPRTVDISPEERLTYSGSISKPLTSWGSVSGDYTSFKEGTTDDSAITFTLIGSSQQNIIQWVVPRDSLMFGTVGGELLLGASNKDESLTPTNVQARTKGTRGSEKIHALLVNDAILFVQRGGRKVRELSNSETYDADNYKADDLTIFSNHITESGIVDWAYQRSPDPVLWCVRDDGTIAVMMYEKQQDVYSWARIVLAGTSVKAESVCVVYGGKNSEDEVWITVSRTVNGATVRNIERFKPRDWGSTLADAFFVDSGYTYDSTATSTITGLTHLIGETVQVFADGVLFDDAVVASDGTITLKLATVTTNASKVQVGLGYNSTAKPMKLDFGGMGLSVIKKVTEGVLQLYKTIGGEWGNATSNMFPINYKSAEVFTNDTLFTGSVTVPFDGGYDNCGDVIIRQTKPYPMTVVALTLDVGVYDK
jgi:hypothetical protein